MCVNLKIHRHRIKLYSLLESFKAVKALSQLTQNNTQQLCLLKYFLLAAVLHLAAGQPRGHVAV